MRKIYLLLLSVLCIAFFSYGQKGNHIATNKTDLRFAEGKVTIKLKPGTGEFEKQTGSVLFGINSLDAKVADFEIFELDKRFKHNTSKMRSDLPDLSRIYMLSIPAKYPLDKVVKAFASDPNVEYAEQVPMGQLFDVPNDNMYSQQQHLPQIFAPQAWNIHKGENGTEETVLAIIDTGVDWDHPDLLNNIWQNLAEDADGDGHTLELSGFQWVLDPGDLNGIDNDGNGFTDDLIGWNFITSNGNPNPIPANPDGGHGTHCAGIANATTNNSAGIASIGWNLTVMPVCATQNNTMTFGYDGIIYAAENGADIISTSWGNWEYSMANQEVINYATGLGSIIVAAAGNDNNDYLVYPSSYMGVISVASVNGDDTRAAYSSFGPAVDISIPGGGSEGGILSTWPGGIYLRGFGTSMATPLVAGCLGLLKSYRPSWTNAQLINQLLGTADNIDSLNPGYEYQLGTGRVNAFRLLSEENVTAPQILEIRFTSMNIDDSNGNNVNEPGEEVTLSPTFRNFTQYAGDDQVIVTLSTDDEDITILNGSAVVNIPADGNFSIEDQFSFLVSNDATSHFAKFTFTFDSDIEIVSDESLNVEVLVAPSGIFVFEGEPNGQDYSGTYIKSILDQLEIPNVYSNTLPASLEGFESVFLSCANSGEFAQEGITLNNAQHQMLQDFLEDGGNLYIEAGGFLLGMQYNGVPSYYVLKQLFGVDSHIQVFNKNPIDSLSGSTNSSFQGIAFNESNQLHNWWIDKIIPKPGAFIPFKEHNYGNVSIMNQGNIFNHKAFYLGYSLAELVDRDPVSSKNNVLLKVLDFFEILPENYILANFIADKHSGGVPLAVTFTDYSLPDSLHPISLWQWDFNNDGIIDSYVQNPTWTFNDAGIYDVKLIVSSEFASDTIIKENFIDINSGFLVYEGVPGGYGYSGSFISDYLQDNAFPTTYRNMLPASLEGFRAVFLSFGNYESGRTIFDDGMARIVDDYLADGGYVYLEGGDALGWDQKDNLELHEKFGLFSVTDGTTNSIDSLVGQPGSLAQDMLFTGSHQLSFSFIDHFVPQAYATTAFNESDYGTVAVQNNLAGAHRTFCFSYALSGLNDGETPNTREQLLLRILNFFDIYTVTPTVNQYQSNQLTIFPNPAYDQVTIITNELTGSSLLTMFTLAGQQVLERKVTSMENQIDISTLSPGMYIVQLHTDKGKLRAKLIIK